MGSDYFKNLKAGKKVMMEIEDSIGSTYKIDGKTPKEWQAEFSFTVPSNATTEDIKRCNAKLIYLQNTASFYLANAQLISDAIDQGARDEYITKFEAKVQEYEQADKRLPARDTLKDLADAGMRELNGAKANASMKQRFWKHLVAGLAEQRKSLEQIMWSISTETKVEMNR